MSDPLSLNGSMTCLLQLTQEVSRLSYKRKTLPVGVRDIRAELELLTAVLRSVQDCESANPGSLPGIEDSIRACLSDVQKLDRKLHDIASRSSFLVKFRWNEKKCSKYILVLQRHRAGLNLALNDVQRSRSKAMETQMEALYIDRQRVDKTRIEDHRIKLLDWLYPEAFDRTHRRIHNRRQKDTGRWILRAPTFMEWKDLRNKILWGYGIPGAGKTFLSSMVIDNLFESAAEKYGIAYIYFHHSEQDQQRPVDVFSSIVKQLVCQLPNIPNEIEQLHDKLKVQQKRPTVRDLYTILVSLTKLFARTFIVCDALDECNQEARRSELLPLFNKIVQEVDISIFLTSREYPEDIQSFFHGSALKIRISANKEDIAYYIEQEINENPRAERLIRQAQCKDRVISCLTDCAKGMFLLVYFHIEYLCQQPTGKQILVELEKISNFSSQERPLDPTYEKTMETLQLQSRSCVNLAFKVLLWLIKAQRTLTVSEIQTAVSIEPERYELETIDLPDRIAILDMCAGFVTIDESNDTIRLAHPTVQDYLLRSSVVPPGADSKLAIACTTFLSSEVFAQGACDSDSALRTRRSLHPFLDYAAKSLSFHLQACKEDLPTQLVLRFLGNPGIISSYLQAVHASPDKSTQNSEIPGEGGYNSYPKGQSPLHVAAALGHCSVVRLLLEGVDIGTIDSKGRTAIHVAASEGHEAVVMLLLQKGANPFIADSDGITAFTWAERKGLHSIVQAMVRKRADFSVTGTAETPQRSEQVDQILPMDNQRKITTTHTNLRSSKVDRYKLETVIYEDHVIHTTYRTDLASGQRKVAVGEKWMRRKEIGIGGFGVVFLEEEERESKLRAVKRLPLGLRNVDYSRELNTLAKLTDREDLFIRFLGWYEDDLFLYIAMEYIEYGDLSQYIKNRSARPKAREITSQLLEGLTVLHERQICHRDLKPQNILVACIEPIWVKITDFGVSKRESGTKLYTQLGTAGYLAPELLGLLPKQFGTGRSYTNAVDLWALGCLVHEILTSKVPFLETPFLDSFMGTSFINDFSQGSIAQEMDMKLIKDYCHGIMEFPNGPLQDSRVSQDGINLVKKLLEANPSSRISAKEGLESPWLLEKDEVPTSEELEGSSPTEHLP